MGFLMRFPSPKSIFKTVAQLELKSFVFIDSCLRNCRSVKIHSNLKLKSFNLIFSFLPDSLVSGTNNSSTDYVSIHRQDFSELNSGLD